MKHNQYTLIFSFLFTILTHSQAFYGSQSSSLTLVHNPSNTQLVSVFDVVKSIIEEIRDEKDETKRFTLCNNAIRLIDSHESKNSEVRSFERSLKQLYDEWVTSRNTLSKRANLTEGLTLQQKIVHQSSYLGLSSGSGIYFRDILRHLETEFLKKSWGRPILVGIQGGVWYRKSLAAEHLLSQESIMSSWMVFLEEMTQELRRVEKLIRVQLNDKEQLVTRVEVAESKELFTSINSFLKLCLYLHQQAADRKIIEVYRKQYAAIMKTPEDSEIMPAFRDTIAAELQSQQES